MKKYGFHKIFILTILSFYICGIFFFSTPTAAKGVKTSYKRYSIYNYKNEEVLCEPYTVNKDDWLYKIFRKKGEISEKDFPLFLFIFKEINPKISNIDAIEPGNHILIPLKKVQKGEYDQSTPGNIDVPVIEFSALPEDFNLTPFIKAHEIKKGENISSLLDKDFLRKGGAISEEGIKAFQLANPNIKNINIVYEGTQVYLPDPSIKSQPWFQSYLTGDQQQDEKQGEKLALDQLKIEAFKLAQLKKYSSLIGGTLLSHGKIYFPGQNDSNTVLDLSSIPMIETDDGSKILIISGENINDELLKRVQAYWKDLKIQVMSETLKKLKNPVESKFSKNRTGEYKKIIATLLSQAGYEYIPNAKIPFMLNNLRLEASFGRIVREDTTDLLINFGNVYGAALDVLEKREFEILSIKAQLSVLELVEKLFSHLGYTTWKNPSFFTGDTVESIPGLYATKGKDKVFIPVKPISLQAIQYLEKEDIKRLSINTETLSQ